MLTGRYPVCDRGSGIATMPPSTDSRVIGPTQLISRNSFTAMFGQNHFGTCCKPTTIHVNIHLLFMRVLRVVCV